MDFFHEMVEKFKLEQEQALQKLLATEEQYNLLYDIAEETDPEVFDVHHEQDYLFFFPSCTIRSLTEQKIEIDDLLARLEYSLLEDWEITKSEHSGTCFAYKYEHEDLNFKIHLRFYNKYCKQVETGKMVPERIWVCGE